MLRKALYFVSGMMLGALLLSSQGCATSRPDVDVYFAESDSLQCGQSDLPLSEWGN